MPTVQVYVSDEMYEWYVENHKEPLTQWVRALIKHEMEASKKKGGKKSEND